MPSLNTIKPGRVVKFTDLEQGNVFRFPVDVWLELRKKDPTITSEFYVKDATTTGYRHLTDFTHYKAKRGLRVEFIAENLSWLP